MTKTMSGGAAGLAFSITGFGVYEARKGPNIVSVTMPFDRLPEELHGFKIAQISDTHVGSTIKRDYMEDVVIKVNSLSPDMICFTGDLADGWVDELDHDVEPLGRLKAQHGVFFVTGNHEYYWDLPGWMAHLKKLGMTLLHNEHRVISHNGKKLVIAGVTDYTAGRYHKDHKSDPEKAVLNKPASELTIVLGASAKKRPGGCKERLRPYLVGSHSWWAVFSMELCGAANISIPHRQKPL